jgi:hypothetical protein
MSDLTSKFTREDLETLLEAMSDWESLGNHEFHVLQMIKNAAMPPEDHEAFEQFLQIKEHFRKREKEIIASREVRQEKAVFLKAKLMLVRKDVGISALFDMAANADANSPAPKPKEEREPEAWNHLEEPVKKAATAAVAVEDEGIAKRLTLAEFFIRDLGVWDHYQKFIAEKSAEK